MAFIGMIAYIMSPDSLIIMRNRSLQQVNIGCSQDQAFGLRILFCGLGFRV